MQLLTFGCHISGQSPARTGFLQYFRILKFTLADFRHIPLNHRIFGEILSFAAYRADIPLPFA
jgi:hypothetical protein